MFKMTKKNMGLLGNYENARFTDLWQVYGSFSWNKQRALDYCKEDMYRFNGYDGRICSYNCMQFTYAFKYDLTDELTGEVYTHLRYHTKDNVYDFRIA